MEQNSRLKPATKHVIRCAAALACPKMAPTFLIGQTLNNVSALSTALVPPKRLIVTNVRIILALRLELVIAYQVSEVYSSASVIV